MWTLILTIAAWGSQTGTSVTAAPGFASQEACMAAAKAWVTHIDAATGTYHMPRALCAKTS